MPLTRWIVATNAGASSEAKDAIVNTLYFNVSGSFDEPGYSSLADDLYAIWAAATWGKGRFIDIRGYDMSDPEPRPQKIRKTGTAAGTAAAGARQVALCLSYYADRNLPRQRGRIYLGPWTPALETANNTQTGEVIALAGQLAGLGGINVDWSLWSPTNQTATRINHAWCDDSWDIIRSRKVAAQQPRRTWTGNG